MRKNIKKKIIIYNKKIKIKYSIIKKIESGIVLNGLDIKSIRNNNINIDNNYILIKNMEVLVFNIKFYKQFYKKKNKKNFIQPKKLLLKKKEIYKLFNKVKKYRYILLISKLYWKNNFIKTEIILAKRKKKYDKRKQIKNKEWKIHQSKIKKKLLY